MHDGRGSSKAISTWSSSTWEAGIEKGVLRLGDHDRLAAVILPGRGTLFVISPSPPHNRLGESRLKAASKHWRRLASTSRRCKATGGLAGACLDWSERRFHLAGALGSAVTARLFELGWVERVGSGR